MSIDQGQGPMVSREFASVLDVMSTFNMLTIANKNKTMTGVILVAGATPLIGTIVGLGRLIYGYSLSFLAKLETNLKDRQIKEIIANHHINHGCRELIPGYLIYKCFKWAHDDAAPNTHPSRHEIKQFNETVRDKMEALEKIIRENNVIDPTQSIYPRQMPEWQDAFIELHNAHVKWYDRREFVVEKCKSFVNFVEMFV